MGEILETTLAFLSEHFKVTSRAIRSIYLNNYFTVVELDDQSVGACMSSYRLAEKDLAEIQANIRSKLKLDPLLLEHTRFPQGSDYNIAQSLRAATISALSARALRSRADPSFVSRTEFPHQFFLDADSAVLIGFGGCVDHLIRCPKIRKLHVSDLLYPSQRAEMDSKVNVYRHSRKDVEISISDGSDSTERLRDADFVSITGSTLSNGTLEPLLIAAKGCRNIVVQGQSASIHPKALFDAGVHLVVTTLKTREVANAAFWDPSGNKLRPLLEGGLPWIYLWPSRSARGFV